MKSSLRTVTNVNIDGKALDAVTQNPTLSFTMNGDSLSWVTIDYTDTFNSQKWQQFYPREGEMIAVHNGETWYGELYHAEDGPSPFTLGHDYTGVITVYQNYPESAENPLNTGDGKYDVYLGAGRIQSAGTALKAYIDKDITVIKDPVRYGARLIGGCLLKVGAAFALIESYDSDTGECNLTSVSVPGGSHLGATSAGALYQLVSNYLECDPFYFMCRSDPAVTLTHEITAEGLKISGSYSQAQEVSMREFCMELESVSDTSDRQYTYTFTHTFPRLCSETAEVSCTIVTQEDFAKSIAHSISETGTLSQELTVSAVWEEGMRSIKLTVTDTAVGGSYSVWRRTDGGKAVFIGRFEPETASFTLRDFTAGTNQSYTYTVSAYREGREYYAASQPVRGYERRYFIAGLTEAGSCYGRTRYTIGESYLFSCDISSSALETVTGAVLHSSNGKKPVLINGVSNYDSGSFEAILGSIESYDSQSGGDIAAWTQFITQGGAYLLKTDMGDVRIIAITGNPSRNYGADAAELGITRIRYEWTETDDIERAVVYE